VPEKSLLRARIDPSLHEWIKKEFPHGFVQAFMEECFLNLREMIEEGRMPAPSEYSRRAAIFAVSTLARQQTEKEKE
jgi:hypothetical protein